MGALEIRQFLTRLVAVKNVSASTQNQAPSTILFLYRHMLHIPLDDSSPVECRPEKPKTVPVVLSKDEAKAVISNLSGVYKIVAQIMYGGGLRVIETLRLRVKDIDFANHQIIVRDGKGENDRYTILPDSIIEPLQTHLQRVKMIHEKDLKKGFGSVYMPVALERKCPNASKDWIWQYLFPASSLFVETESKITRRHHCSQSIGLNMSDIFYNIETQKLLVPNATQFEATIRAPRIIVSIPHPQHQ